MDIRQESKGSSGLSSSIAMVYTNSSGNSFTGSVTYMATLSLRNSVLTLADKMVLQTPSTHEAPLNVGGLAPVPSEHNLR